MREDIKRIRAAVATRDTIAHLTHYLIKDGYAHASNGRLKAAVPVDDDRTYLVPATDLEKVLDLCPGEPKIVLEENAIRVSSGRFRAKIETLDPEIMVIVQPEDSKLQEVKPGFLEALKKVRAFISDNATRDWAMCVCIHGDYMYATNNVALVRADSFLPHTDQQYLLPVWAVDFILGQGEDPGQVAITEQAIKFIWPDGLWVMTQLIIGQFPEQAFTMLDDLEEPVFPVCDDWREAYDKIAAYSEREIYMYEERMTGGANHTNLEYEVYTPVPEGKEYSKWHPKFLAPVIRHATHWQPDIYPKPAPFYGEGIRGVVTGKS